MFIKDIFSTKKLSISFEIFPPKNDNSLSGIYKTIEELKGLKPDFISVTYGAGGSSKDKTIEIASTIKNKYNIETLAHLTCITSTKGEIDNILNELKKNNIYNILALRGDIPENFQVREDLNYKYAKDLIKEVIKKKDFGIAAAAYPEGHLESKDIDEDIEHLKEKVECGVDFLITQLFFDNNNFYNFREKLYKYGVNVPIVTGIMPVTNKNQIQRIVALSGAFVPEKLKSILDKYQDQPESLKEAGIEYAIGQVTDLISNGVQGIHVYTMNKSDVVGKIIKNISEADLK